MDGLQWTSHFNSVNAIGKKSLLCLALMLALYPTLSRQELTAHSRHFPPSSKATGKIQRASTTLHHGSPAASSPQMAAMTNGNATLEDISERLGRVDNSLASLIQTVLTVQRTVFNLEQLQELLVLLLEDILKQVWVWKLGFDCCRDHSERELSGLECLYTVCRLKMFILGINIDIYKLVPNTRLAIVINSIFCWHFVIFLAIDTSRRLPVLSERVEACHTVVKILRM